MLFGTKVMAIVGIVAIICAIAVAFVLLNQNNDTSDLSGNWTLYDLNGVDGSILAGLITEIVLNFIIVLVVFGATAKNGMEKFAGFFIGLALTMVHFVGIALTGISVNPARSSDSLSSSPRHSATFGFHRCTYHRWNPRLGRLEESPL